MKYAVPVALLLLSLGCSHTAAPTDPTAPQPDPLSRYEALLHQHVPILSSDEFGGRQPATQGEDLTVEYIRRQFNELGLAQGNDDSWYQQVPISEITPSATNLQIRGKSFKDQLIYHKDIVISTPQQIPYVDINNSELVFVGYGIVAPEYNWNDYENIDVKGKTVIALVNDPGFATQDEALFKGNTMTWYGRWSYKFEEAARQGAAAILVVHEDRAAGYPFSVVSSSPTPPADLTLTAANLNRHLCRMQGWIRHQRAADLFDAAGLSLTELTRSAAQPGFQARSLGLFMDAQMKTEVRHVESRNVLGLIRGSEKPDEVIIYTAHWDHLGTTEGIDGDNIYNGAMDNATGIAGMFALAESFKQVDPPPRRSILFLATTSEESGLLGSKFYAENPVFPPENTVAAINMDSLPIYGPVKDVVVIGHGNNELQEYLADAASAQNRVVLPEPTPERGYYFRSDHFSMARIGIPALFARGGYQHVEKGYDWAKAMADDYIANHYHQPSDEYDPDWDLRGAAQDLQLYYKVGYRLSLEDHWPVWYDGSEFKSVREKTEHTD